MEDRGTFRRRRDGSVHENLKLQTKLKAYTKILESKGKNVNMMPVYRDSKEKEGDSPSF